MTNTRSPFKYTSSTCWKACSTCSDYLKTLKYLQLESITNPNINHAKYSCYTCRSSCPFTSAHDLSLHANWSELISLIIWVTRLSKRKRDRLFIERLVFSPQAWSATKSTSTWTWRSRRETPRAEPRARRSRSEKTSEKYSIVRYRNKAKILIKHTHLSLLASITNQNTGAGLKLSSITTALIRTWWNININSRWCMQVVCLYKDFHLLPQGQGYSSHLITAAPVVT